MTLRIFTLVSGEPYQTWMQNGLVESLSWPRNKSAIRHAQWHIYTTEESHDRVVEIARPLGLDIVVEIMRQDWAGAFLAHAINHCLRDCAEQGDQMLVCPPDTIFGEGTMETIMTMAREPKVVVSAVPVRVNQDFMDEFFSSPYENSELVTLAWKHLHATWRDANIHLPRNNSFAGGVSWKKVGEKLVAVTHLLPTPFYVDPTPSDAEWFRQYGMPGAFDHLWPAKIVDEGRQRFIGSSDAAFAVEITESDKNIPVLYPVDPANPTNYLGNQKHNHVNRNTVCVFRMQ